MVFNLPKKVSKTDFIKFDKNSKAVYNTPTFDEGRK